MKKVYLIMETEYSSNYSCGYTERAHLVSYDKKRAEKYAEKNTNYHKAACGCCYTGYSYSVEEIDVLDE